MHLSNPRFKAARKYCCLKSSPLLLAIIQDLIAGIEVPFRSRNAYEIDAENLTLGNYTTLIASITNSP